MSVYKAIVAVQATLAQRGISKDKKNTQQGYSFRGIDDVYGALAPALATCGLCILPRVISRTSEERQTKSGGTLNYVTLSVEFDLVAAEDGSKHTICTYGEAMDSADKATNKAMSAAYKYAAMQAFCIPVEGEPDADADHHEPKPKASTKPAGSVPQNTAAKKHDEKHTAPPEQPAPEANTVTGFIEDVTMREGTGAKGQWTKYGVKIDGQFYGTFNSGHGETARMMMEDKREVCVTWEADKSGKYKNLTGIYAKEDIDADTSFPYGANAE